MRRRRGRRDSGLSEPAGGTGGVKERNVDNDDDNDGEGMDVST